MKIFSPAVRYNSANSWGRQLVEDTAGFLTRRNAFKVGEQDNIKAEEYQVDKFIEQYEDIPGRLENFMVVLGEKTETASKSAKTYSLEEISDFFPWVMSCESLFEPLRTMIYAIEHNYKPTDVPRILEVLDTQTLNLEVNRIILNDLKMNGNVLQAASAVLQKRETGILTKLWSEWVKSTNVLALAFNMAILGPLEVLQSLPTLGEKLKSAASQMSEKISSVWTAWKGLTGNGKKFVDDEQFERLDKDGHLYQFMGYMAGKVIAELRVYGEIVINFNYVKQSALKKYVDGTLFYFYPQHPSVLLSMENSFATVYRLVNGNIVQIPENQFTIKYLRSMIEGYVRNFSENMFASIRSDLVLTKKQKQGRQEFYDSYLSDKKKWDIEKGEELVDIDEKELPFIISKSQAIKKKNIITKK